MKIKNIIGKSFGKLIVIKKEKPHLNPNGRKRLQYLCKCSCGNRLIVLGESLRSGHTISCGCYLKNKMKERLIDLTNKKFGKLKVLRLDHIKKSSYWLCKCDCGNTTVVFGGFLKNGKTKSCGCQTESFIASYLKGYFVKFYNAKKEYKLFKNKNNNYWLRCDIYIPEGNIYIEIHGEQHYVISGWSKIKAKREKIKPEEVLLKQKQYDKIKKKFCKNNGKYIEINLMKIKTKEDALSYILERI